jgi:hypothetical protein
LAKYNDKFKQIFNQLEFNFGDGQQTSEKLKWASKQYPDKLAQSIASVEGSFSDSLSTSSEKFVGAILNSIDGYYNDHGLTLNSDNIVNTSNSLVSAISSLDEPNHKIVSENLKYLKGLMDSKRIKYMAKISEKQQELQIDMNKTRVETAQTVLSALRNYNLKKREIADAHIKLLEETLCCELEIQEQLKSPITQNKAIGTHRLSIPIWLETQEVYCTNLNYKTYKCLLTDKIIDDTYEHQDMYITEYPLDQDTFNVRYKEEQSECNTSNLHGVLLYNDIVREVIYRVLQGMCFYGYSPLVSTYDQDLFLYPENQGLYYYKLIAVNKSRVSENDIIPIQILSPSDVRKILNDKKVQPWWEFVSTFNTFKTNPKTLITKTQFANLMERFGNQISANDKKKLQDEYTKMRTYVDNKNTTTLRSMHPPANFRNNLKELYASTLGKRRVNTIDDVNKNWNKHFQEYYNLQINLLKTFWNIYKNIPDKYFKNPLCI